MKSEIVRYWALCSTDTGKRYIKQTDDGCLAMFADEKDGFDIENQTPDSELISVDYIRVKDHLSTLDELSALVVAVDAYKNSESESSRIEMINLAGRIRAES